MERCITALGKAAWLIDSYEGACLGKKKAGRAPARAPPRAPAPAPAPVPAPAIDQQRDAPEPELEQLRAEVQRLQDELGAKGRELADRDRRIQELEQEVAEAAESPAQLELDETAVDWILSSDPEFPTPRANPTPRARGRSGSTPASPASAAQQERKLQDQSAYIAQLEQALDRSEAAVTPLGSPPPRTHTNRPHMNELPGQLHCILNELLGLS